MKIKSERFELEKVKVEGGGWVGITFVQDIRIHPCKPRSRSSRRRRAITTGDHRSVLGTTATPSSVPADPLAKEGVDDVGQPGAAAGFVASPCPLAGASAQVQGVTDHQYLHNKGGREGGRREGGREGGILEEGYEKGGI